MFAGSFKWIAFDTMGFTARSVAFGSRMKDPISLSVHKFCSTSVESQMVSLT